MCLRDANQDNISTSDGERASEHVLATSSSSAATEVPTQASMSRRTRPIVSVVAENAIETLAIVVAPVLLSDCS